MQKTVLITGSQGFIGSYVCNELLEKGYRVIGVDNFSKYGKVTRKHDKHVNFILVTANCSKKEFLEKVSDYKFDFIIFRDQELMSIFIQKS